MIDCLEVMYLNFDHFILADQSSGHTRKQISGCDNTKMNTGYWGAQPAITNLVVCSDDYGPSNIEGRHNFAVNFERSFLTLDVCTENDGPYWMSIGIGEQLKTKANIIDGTLKEKVRVKMTYY